MADFRPSAEPTVLGVVARVSDDPAAPRAI
jgi:hypothetical protein